MTHDIAVIGLGAMGAALARAQMAAGHRIIIWNRSADKAEALRRDGASRAETAGDAVLSADVALICVDTNTSAVAALGDVFGAGRLQDKTVVQLSTTTPGEARDFAGKLRGAGALALDGAIMCYPDSIGPGNDAPIMVGGDPDGYAKAEPYLRNLSRNLIPLGDNIAAAAALDLGLLTTSVALYAGVAHAARLCEAEGADVDLLGKLCAHGPRAPERFEIIARNAFALNALHDGGSLDVWADVVDRIRDQAQAAGINADLPEFLSRLYRRAADAGHGAEDVAALIKVLRPT